MNTTLIRSIANNQLFFITFTHSRQAKLMFRDKRHD